MRCWARFRRGGLVGLLGGLVRGGVRSAEQEEQKKKKVRMEECLLRIFRSLLPWLFGELW